jgi:hypothetical protein
LVPNLVVILERGLRWLEPMTIGTLRCCLFVTAEVMRLAQVNTTIRLAVPDKERDWWRRLWD